MKDVVNAFTERNFRFDVRIKGKGFIQWLRNIGLVKRSKQFTVKPLVTGTLTRISELILTIDNEAFQPGDLFTGFLKLSAANGNTMANIVALAVTNEKQRPDNDLIEFFLWNLTAKELNELVKQVVEAMDVENFTSSIISVKSINILEMNPQTGMSQIAPHGPLQTAS